MNTGKLFVTNNSTYEVGFDDEGAERIRRIKGVNPPTPHTGEDEAWQPGVHHIMLAGGRRHLLIQWGHGGTTLTSAIQDES